MNKDLVEILKSIVIALNGLISRYKEEDAEETPAKRALKDHKKWLEEVADKWKELNGKSS